MPRPDHSAGDQQHSEPGSGISGYQPKNGAGKGDVPAHNHWISRLRIGPLGPVTLGVVALSFIALLISGRLRMLYPQPRTVIAKPAESKGATHPSAPPSIPSNPAAPSTPSNPSQLTPTPEATAAPDPISDGTPPAKATKPTPQPVQSDENR